MVPDTVNIIVIGYTVSKIVSNLESSCIKSVIYNTNTPYMLTYVNNLYSGMTLTDVWNYSISNSPCEYICLLNSDTEVFPGWLPKILDTLKSDNTYGFVGPSTDNCHSKQKSIPSYEQSKKFSNQVEVLDSPLSGFCLLFRKSLWSEIGGFDTRFPLYGQESKFLDDAMNKGYKCVWRKDAFVHHVGEATMKAAGVDTKSERKKATDLYWRLKR